MFFCFSNDEQLTFLRKWDDDLIQSEFQMDGSDISVENMLRERKKIVDSDVYYNSHCNNLDGNHDDLSKSRIFGSRDGEVVCSSIHPPIHLSSCPPVHPSIHQSTYPSIHLINKYL